MPFDYIDDEPELTTGEQAIATQAAPTIEQVAQQPIPQQAEPQQFEQMAQQQPMLQEPAFDTLDQAPIDQMQVAEQQEVQAEQDESSAIMKYGFPGVNEYLKNVPLEEMGTPSTTLKASLIGVGDIFSRLPAIVEGMFDSNKSIGEALAGKDPGILKKDRQQVREFWGNLSQGTDNPVYKKVFQTLGVLGEGGYGLFEDPLGFATQGIKTGAREIAQMRLRGAPRAALTTAEGIPLSPAQALGKERSSWELYAQSNPFTEDIPLRLKELQLAKLEETASGISKGIGGQPARNIEKSVRGDIIERKITDFKNITQKQFREGEDLIKSSIGKAPINLRKVDVFGPSKAGLIDAQGKPINNVIHQVSQTNAVDKMDNMLRSVGHEIGDPVSNIGGISDKAITKTLKFRKDIAGAKNINDLLNVKKNISGEVFSDVEKGIFTGDRDVSFLRGINHELNNAIEESIKAVSPGVSGENLASTFRAINKNYGDNLDALMSPSKKFGIGRADFRPEDVIGKIKLIGSKNLKNLKEASKTKPEVKAIYEELQKGAYEDLLSKSMNYKTMELSPDSFTSNWGKLDAGTKNALFDHGTVGEIDKLIEVYKKVTSGDLAKFNPSGTAKAQFINKVFKDPGAAFTALATGLFVKRYYKTGKLPHQSVVNLLRTSGNKVYMTADKLKTIQKASSLGQFLRTPQKENK